MKEWDHDSYNRKWRSSVGFYKDEVGRITQCYYTDFFDIEENEYAAHVLLSARDTDTRTVAIECDHDDFSRVELLYHPVDSGWYQMTDGGVALLTRIHHRGFKIGLSNESHRLSAYHLTGTPFRATPAFMKVNFLARPAYEQYDPEKSFGILSDKVWWREGALRYLSRVIGYFRNEGKEVCLEDAAYVPFVKPLLGEKCQIGL